MANPPDRQHPDPNAFLMGGGVPSASFQKIGASVCGTITEPLTIQQQRDYTTQEPKHWDDGSPMMHLVVTLQTDENDPEIEDDDGRRRIYVKNNMKRAVSDAVRKVKAKGLEVGGHLTVTYTSNGEATKKGAQPPKLYSAEYETPANAALHDDRSEDSVSGGPDTTDWAWSDGVRYANDNGITEADLKSRLQKAAIKKWDATAKAAVVKMCQEVGASLSESDIPF